MIENLALINANTVDMNKQPVFVFPYDSGEVMVRAMVGALGDYAVPLTRLAPRTPQQRTVALAGARLAYGEADPALLHVVRQCSTLPVYLWTEYLDRSSVVKKLRLEDRPVLLAPTQPMGWSWDEQRAQLELLSSPEERAGILAWMVDGVPEIKHRRHERRGVET